MMRLIDLQSGKEIKIGDAVEIALFGRMGEVRMLDPPDHPEGIGRVLVQPEGKNYSFPYQPQEIGAKFTDGADLS